MALLALEAEGVAMRGRYRDPAAARRRRGVVRPAPARAHSSADPAAPARAGGAGQPGGADAVPVCLARPRRGARGGRRSRAPRSAEAAGLSRAGGGLGRFAAAGAHRALRGDGSRRRCSAPGSSSGCAPEPSPGRASARPARYARRRSCSLDRGEAGTWMPLLAARRAEDVPLSSAARAIRSALESRGAMFFVDLVRVTGLLRTQVEQGLSELVAWGAGHLRQLHRPARADHAREPARQLLAPGPRRRRQRGQRGTLVPGGRQEVNGERRPMIRRPDGDAALAVAQVLLERYGVVFRALLRREALVPAAVAGTRPRVPQARSPRRDPRRPIRDRLQRRAVRAAGSSGGPARHAPARPGRTRSWCRPPIRSTSAASRRPVRACRRHRAIACSTVAACRWRHTLPARWQWLVPPDPRQEWAARNLLIRSDRERFYLPADPRQN